MTNRLSELRKARGIPAVTLAEQAGITRQAIYAIEACTYMPNTAVALRLARALETTVESLFALDEEPSAPATMCGFEPLDERAPIEPGEPVQLCRVGRQTYGVAPAPFSAYLPAADGIVCEPGRAAVISDPESENRLLLAGCDPALSLLSAHAREAGIEVVLANSNSSRALDSLRRCRVDIAGTHLDGAPESDRKFAVVTFAAWQEGFVVARGNPKGVRRVEDLANPAVRFINRDEGSGSRSLFDCLIRRAGMPASLVKGADHAAPGHLAAAWAVASGAADCCIAAGSAARRFGLDFIPLAGERFDLVLHKRDLRRKAVEAVLDVLNRSRFRRQLEMLAGYDVSKAGATQL